MAGPARRGAALFTALVCLAVISIICGSLIKVTLAQRQQIRLEERKLQAEWLAESALERAAAKLASSKSYSGETWQLAAVELGGRWGATVTITVGSVADQPSKRLVKVQADYPAASEQRVRHSKQVYLKSVEQTSGGNQ